VQAIGRGGGRTAGTGRPFWRKTVKKSFKGGELGAAYEVGELVRKMFGDAGQALEEAMKRRP